MVLHHANKVCTAWGSRGGAVFNAVFMEVLKRLMLMKMSLFLESPGCSSYVFFFLFSRSWTRSGYVDVDERSWCWGWSIFKWRQCSRYLIILSLILDPCVCRVFLKGYRLEFCSPRIYMTYGFNLKKIRIRYALKRWIIKDVVKPNIFLGLSSYVHLDKWLVLRRSSCCWSLKTSDSASALSAVILYLDLSSSTRRAIMVLS